MEIEDKRCQVKSYNEYERERNQVSATILKLDYVMDLLQQPPKHDSPANILNVLNDDCIREILKKLHFSTLNSVVNVCIRFNYIAKEAFLSKYQSKQISISDLEWNRQPTLSQVNNFLCEFGSSISSLSLLKRELFRHVDKNIKDTDVQLKMINKYCKKLTELAFSCLEVHEHTLYEIRGVLKRLKILRIENITSTSFFDIISVCSELEILEMHFEYQGNSTFILPNTTFPKLFEVVFSYKWDTNFAPILRFIELHPTLKILKMSIKSTDWVGNVLGGLNELNELKISYSYEFSPHITQALSALNVQMKLDLWNVLFRNNFISTISEFRNITEFRIQRFFNLNIDKLVLLLKNLPNIKRLHFDLYQLEDFDAIEKNEIFVIKKIVQHANQLSELILHSTSVKRMGPFRQYPIDDLKYHEILESVENRISDIKLTIEFIFIVDLRSEYSSCSQSIFILNMVPKLSISQRTNLRGYHFNF